MHALRMPYSMTFTETELSLAPQAELSLAPLDQACTFCHRLVPNLPRTTIIVKDLISLLCFS